MSAPAHDHVHGLGHDLDAMNATLLQRRRALAWLARAGVLPLALPLASCGGSSDDASSTTSSASSDTAATTTSSGSTTATTSSCSVIPTETNGPYPADGTTALNALLLSGIVRSDIRSSFAGASGVASGVPLTVTLNLVNTNSNCASLADYAVYIWHCSATGLYSLYSSGVTGENFLRGVQAADSNGQVSFTTIVPGCYVGRWPHIHVEVYPNLASATSVSKVSKITQIAIPEATCSEVYATSGYGSSASNLGQITLPTDNVFSDGATLETPTITGSASAGYALTLTVGIAA